MNGADPSNLDDNENSSATLDAVKLLAEVSFITHACTHLHTPHPYYEPCQLLERIFSLMIIICTQLYTRDQIHF